MKPEWIEITQDKLKELILYNPDTGALVWRKSKGAAKEGSECGSIGNFHGKSYRSIMINGKTYYAHRLAWLYVYGNFPEEKIDHIDGNEMNNRILNLRTVSQSDNCRNRKMPVTNNSGVCGVSIHKQTGKWRARIRHKGKLLSLGLFNNLEDAKDARESAIIKYGYHANHGRLSNG